MGIFKNCKDLKGMVEVKFRIKVSWEKTFSLPKESSHVRFETLWTSFFVPFLDLSFCERSILIHILANSWKDHVPVTICWCRDTCSQENRTFCWDWLESSICRYLLYRHLPRRLVDRR